MTSLRTCWLWLIVVLAPATVTHGQMGLGGAPSQTYFGFFPAYYDGEYREALEGFLDESRSSMKFGAVRWVDAIAYHTMTGECYYQLGQLDAAMENYTAALQLYLANQEWMVAVRFDAAIRPAGAGTVQSVPWGQSQRTFRVGEFKTDNVIQIGQINNNAVVQQGGVVQQPMMLPVNVQEIVRTTALAMRRRSEILGPLAANDQLTNTMIEALSRRRAQVSHWSEAWVDVELGAAYAAGGKDALAKGVLERAIVARGEFDHPLTGMALLELGRIAMRGGDPATASKLLEEATYAAVNFSDVTTLQEAFELGYRVHLAANRRGMFTPLAPAAEWAKRQDLVQLRVSLLTMAAENACIVGDPATASKILAELKPMVARTDINISRLGARMNHAIAMTLYLQGNTSGGDSAIESAMKFQRAGGLRLYQIACVDRALTAASNPLSPRVAMDAYAKLLTDPTPVDWSNDPVDMLATLTVQHSASYENWFDVAIARREYPQALTIADLARRHRFLSTLDLGGRLLNLRWLLESPADTLSEVANLQRQDLLLRYPQYKEWSTQASELRRQLAASPLMPDEPAAARAQEEQFKQLAKLTAQQEAALREIAIRREAIETLFPPVRTTPEVQSQLADHEGLLAYFCTSRQTHGFLLSKDKFAYWTLTSPADVQKQLVELLHTLGNWDQNKQLKAADLNDHWRQAAQRLYSSLTKESKADLPYEFEKLVIVPDNVLWYVPFEALESRQGDDYQCLVTRMQIRYVPTMGLATGDPRPRLPNTNVGVVLRRMYPGESEEVSTTALADFQQAVPGAVGIQGQLNVPSSLLGSLLDQLTVLSDLSPATGGAYNWSPIPLDERLPASKLTAWMGLPWNGPDQMILPGFHTSAEDGLKTSAAGSDVFLPVCGLMASGARTVLISRWRTGGQSSYDLVREFAQELPFTSAAEAWQRSVLLERDRELNPEREPRLSESGVEMPPTGEHPFFWAGYLLIDTGAKPTR